MPGRYYARQPAVDLRGVIREAWSALGARWISVVKLSFKYEQHHGMSSLVERRFRRSRFGF